MAALLAALERDELLDLALGVGRQGVEALDELDVARGDGFLGDPFEELADAQLELGEDAEEGVQADPILPLLHAGEVGLLNTQPARQLDLGQFVLLAKLADLAPHQLYLTDLLGGHVDMSEKCCLCQNGIAGWSTEDSIPAPWDCQWRAGPDLIYMG